MSPTALHFTGETHGWLLVDVGNAAGHAYVELFRTTDGGATWERIVDPFTPVGADLHVSSSARSMMFADTQTGVISIGESAYSSPRINWTRDGGTTWRSVPLAPPAAEPDLFEQAFCGAYWPRLFTDLSAAIVVECSNNDMTARYLYVTSDGGQTWEQFPYPGSGLLMLDPLVGFALRRDFYRTDDGGRTWTKVSTVPWDGQYSFMDEQYGWTVPWDGQYSFVGEQYGWAVARSGDESALFRSSDGGRTWEQLEPAVGE